MTSLNLRQWRIILTLLLLANFALGTYAFVKKPLRQQPQQQSSAQPAVHEPRENSWREDLEFFDKTFPSVQMDFDKLYSAEKFHGDVANLERNVSLLPDSEIVLRLMQLVAGAGVSHITLASEGNLEFHPYPVHFSWYADGAGLNYATEE